MLVILNVCGVCAEMKPDGEGGGVAQKELGAPKHFFRAGLCQGN